MTIFFLLPVLAVFGEVLIWVSPPLADPLLATMTAACRSQTRNGQPLLGTPLICNSTTDVRSKLLGQNVVTPHTDGTNLPVGYGDTILCSDSQEVLNHSFARADGTPNSAYYVYSGCDNTGQRMTNNDCLDWTSAGAENGAVGCALHVGCSWIACGANACYSTSTYDTRVYCFLTITASPTTSPTTAPTTSPISASPTVSPPTTTVSPTTGSPTTTSPTTSPTTTSPTTTSPTTTSPTTTSPTSAPSANPTSPTTTAPTLVSPTSPPSASPTTLQPTAADATVSEAASQKKNEWAVAAVCIVQLLFFFFHAF